MEGNLILWWKGLNHNQRKNLIANFDFFTNKIEIKPYNELYSQYKIAFGKGIRERLDDFNVDEKSLSELTHMTNLVINHNSFQDFTNLTAFTNLENLYFSNNTVENLETLKNLNIKTLTLSCSKLKNLNGIEKNEKLENLKLIYCYDLDNLNFLTKCPKLNKLDLSYLGSIALFDELFNIDDIVINKNIIYPNDIEYTLYKSKYGNYRHKLYEFTEEETQFILENAKDKQRKNYAGLIISKKYSVYINDFTEWTLKRTTANSTLPKAGQSWLKKLFGSE